LNALWLVYQIPWVNAISLDIVGRFIVYAIELNGSWKHPDKKEESSAK